MKLNIASESAAKRAALLAHQLAELDVRLAEAKNEPSLIARLQSAKSKLHALKERIGEVNGKHSGACSCADDVPKLETQARQRLDALRFDFDRIDRLSSPDISLGGAINALIDFDEAISALEHFIANAPKREAVHRADAKKQHAEAKKLKADVDACETEIRQFEDQIKQLRDQLETVEDFS